MIRSSNSADSQRRAQDAYEEERNSEKAGREEGSSKEGRGQEGGEEVTSAGQRNVDPARIRNAWAGRISGCQLGKAVEGLSVLRAAMRN
jgi:hypothetical protein